MGKVTVIPLGKIADGWIDPACIPAGADENYIRNSQVKVPSGGWRHLTEDETDSLIRNGNTASSWDSVWVTDRFEPRLVRNNSFYGTVRIGAVEDCGLQFNDMRIPAGITGSSIFSCDIGDNCAIHDVGCLSHYIIGDRCILSNVQEMYTTERAKFGNGVVKEGEDEEVRLKIDVMNEAGCRAISPFDGMIAADAYLWAKYIDDSCLQQSLVGMTQRKADSRRGCYGVLSEGSVVRASRIIEDVMTGENCCIEGASRLRNLTINSSAQEPSHIGENVILTDGIVGYGCNVLYGCTAVRFVLGSNCNLKYGARLIDTFVGDNSTISCCEVLNSLIFPAHEQHHNNSFLIASCIKGQSNLAAGATVGSNHNSRTYDNEVVAGRGFWPGLCTSVKHSSVFASYVLLAKGAYPAEMNIQMPFSMLHDNEAADELSVMPAYWWTHNMYALARNNWKFKTRDKRKTRQQNIESGTYAPDSMEEVSAARDLLARWTGKAWILSKGEDAGSMSDAALEAAGAAILESDPDAADRLEVFGEGMEKSRRKVRIIKPGRAYRAYGDMITHYFVMNVMDRMEADPAFTADSLAAMSAGDSTGSWVNLGGQLVKESDTDALRSDICCGSIDSWDALHARYNELWRRYPYDRLQHAVRVYCRMKGTDHVSPDEWKEAVSEEIRIQQYIAEQVRESRRKDYDNPFRQATYRSMDEMIAAIGPLDENSFVRQIAVESAAEIEKLKKHKI